MASISTKASPSPAVPGIVELSAAGGVILLAILVAHWNVLTWHALPYEEYFDFYLRIIEYERELAAGFWPQNLPDAVRGAGHAFPRFYPPFAYAVALLINAVVDDVIITTHVTVLLPFLIGGLLTYVVVRRTGGTRAGATLAALILVTWPYLGIALHPRGAFAELWTLPWYPLLALAVMRTRERGMPPWWLPIPLAGLCVSHAVMSLWTLPVVVIAAFLASSGVPAKLRVLRLTTVGAALTAFFTLPMTWYRETVRVADPVTMWATPERLTQHTGLLTLPPVWVTFEVLLIVTAVVVLARLPDRAGPWRPMWWAALLQAAYSLATVAPLPFWQLVPSQLRYLQFPFRLHGPSGFLAALALGWLASRVRVQGRVVACIIGTVPLLAGWTAYMHANGLPMTHARAETVVAMIDGPRLDRGLTTLGDYLPRGSDPLRLSAAVQRTLDSLRSGTGDRWERTPRLMRLTPAPPRIDSIVLPLSDYDFYDVRDQDGRSLRRSAVEGQLRVHVDAGVRQVVVTRRAPWPLRIGALITLLGIVALIGGAPRPSRHASAVGSDRTRVT